MSTSSSIGISGSGEASEIKRRSSKSGSKEEKVRLYIESVLKCLRCECIFKGRCAGVRV